MAERDIVARRVTAVGAWVNVLLAALKTVVGILTNSAALLADAIHSLSDLISDAVVFFAIILGSREADENHPYGHRRYETLATFLVGLLIIATGLGLGYEMVLRIQDSTSWHRPETLALYAAAVSILIKELLYHYTKAAGSKHNHALLQANATHHRTDALSSLVVFAGLLASQFGISVGDLAAALVVAFMLTRSGLKISYDALLEISEAGVDPQTNALIRETVLDTWGVVDMHMLKTKVVGGEIFAETHAQVRPYISVTQGHEIAHRIMSRVEKAVPGLVEITVHIDPEDDEHNTPNLSNCATIENEINSIWEQLMPDQELPTITLHLLSTGTEVVLRVTEVEGLDAVRAAILELKGVSRVDFVTLLDL